MLSTELHHTSSPDFLHTEGYAVIPNVLSEAQCAQLLQHTAPFQTRSRSSRTALSLPWCQELARHLKTHPAIKPLLVPDAVAVQCTYFEKSADRNWLVSIHQDLSAPVAQRIDHPQLQGWSEKEGQVFMQPPESIMRQMLALRLHLEPCTETDGPLKVYPRTHHHIDYAPDSAQDREEITLTAATGTVIAMRPMTLHASSKASGHSKRRLLHFLMGPADLPYGLQWEIAV